MSLVMQCVFLKGGTNTTTTCLCFDNAASLSSCRLFSVKLTCVLALCVTHVGGWVCVVGDLVCGAFAEESDRVFEERLGLPL